MVEAKLLAGRFLNFNRPAGRKPTRLAPVWVTLVLPVLRIELSDRRNPGAALNPFRNVGGLRQSSVATGAHATKAHRNFKWLPWYEGDISETLLDHDVLTGPMSGCALVTYRKAAGGPRYAAHIGTITETEATVVGTNAAVKALFTTALANNTIRDARGFIPTANAVPAHPAHQGDDSAAETWGLMTTGGDFYTIRIWVQRHTGAAVTSNRIALVHQVQTMTPQQLLAI
jgi:hypothetical protein